MPNSIKYFFKKRMNVWLKKRIPVSEEHHLTSRNIFIFPTPFGFAYLGFVILLFLLGTNYQNNLIMLLSYLLASFFITVMLHSFYNFSQLSFRAKPEQTGFAEQKVIFPIFITSTKSHYDLNFSFANSNANAKADSKYKNLAKSLNKNLQNTSELNTTITKPIKISEFLPGTTRINLPYSNNKRGKHSIGRVTIYSEYSFGFFKSWTHLDFGLSALIYPKPVALALNDYPITANKDDNESTSYQNSHHTGIDDFSELKNYVLGESRARTAWKQLARGQGHYSKHYQENHNGEVCLTLASMPSNHIEVKLNYLSFLINELSQKGQQFSLELTAENGHTSSHIPGNIPSNTGHAHQQACLTALAYYHV